MKFTMAFIVESAVIAVVSVILVAFTAAASVIKE